MTTTRLPHTIAAHAKLALMESQASRPARQPGRGLARFVREIDPHAIDAAIALAVSAAGLAMLLARAGEENEFRSDDALGIILVLGQTLPLATRRVSPLGVVLAINVALVAHSALGYQIIEAGTLGSLISVYGAASLVDSRGALVLAGLTVFGVAGFFATNRADYGLVDALITGVTWMMGLLLGVFIRIRGEQAEAAGARVAHLELDQEARAREAVAGERARMARELHDIVGHALNVIVIQAAGARRVFDARPEASREALASIESAGREALFDMERMLGVLTGAAETDGASEPQPGLGQIESLAAHVSEAGIPVQVVVEGERQEVPASVELSAYRIVQEALTNCLKHSRASHATVTVRYGVDDVEVEVVDDGRGSSDSTVTTGGRGHLGMRERVALFGGEISIGPVSRRGGYRVRARLPFTSASG